VDASSTCGRSRNLDRAFGVFMAEMIEQRAPRVLGRVSKIRDGGFDARCAAL
jgi:hypothetical protein